MEEDRKISKGEYTFYSKWIDKENQERLISIHLAIDYSRQRFMIVQKEAIRNTVSLISENEDSVKQWNAFVECINKAIVFAKKELGFSAESS